MTLWNIIITPMYLGQDRQYIIENLLIYIVGFNAIKVGVNIALVLMLYKPLSSVLKAISLLEKSELEEVQDTCQMTIHTTNITYASEKYQIVLQADLDEDLYKLVVTEF